MMHVLDSMVNLAVLELTEREVSMELTVSPDVKEAQGI